MKELYYEKDYAKIHAFKEEVREFASAKKLEIQETQEDVTEWICQMKRGNKYTLGVTSRAATVIIEDVSADTIKIRLGEAKWTSKIAGAVVTTLSTGGLLLIAAPVTITGVLKQASLLKGLQKIIKKNFD